MASRWLQNFLALEIPKTGRAPKIDRGLRDLIQQMSKENSLWGASRIHGELLMFGVRGCPVDGLQIHGAGWDAALPQSWKTFLRNHAQAIAAIDLCVVPTLTFERLFPFLVLGHSRRQLIWFEVTRAIRRPSGWPDRSPRPSLGRQRRAIWCATMTEPTDMPSRPGSGPWVSATGQSPRDRHDRTGMPNV